MARALLLAAVLFVLSVTLTVGIVGSSDRSQRRHTQLSIGDAASATRQTWFGTPEEAALNAVRAALGGEAPRLDAHLIDIANIGPRVEVRGAGSCWVLGFAYAAGQGYAATGAGGGC